MGNEKGMIETDVISWSSEHFHGGLVYLLYGKSSFNSSVVQIFEQTGPSPGDASLWHGCRPCVLDVIFRGLFRSPWMDETRRWFLDFFFLLDFPKIKPKPQWVFGPLRCLQSLFGRRWPLFPTAHKEETALTNALKAQRKLSLICSLACVESCIKSSLRMLFPLLPNPFFEPEIKADDVAIEFISAKFAKILLPLWVSRGLRVWSRNSISSGWIWIWWISLLLISFNVQNPPAAQGRQMNAILK